jgi:hypothetical protein
LKPKKRARVITDVTAEMRIITVGDVGLRAGNHSFNTAAAPKVTVSCTATNIIMYRRVFFIGMKDYRF